MGIKSFGAKIYSNFVLKGVRKWSKEPVKTQDTIMHHLVASATKTVFGKDHNFNEIENYEDFKKHVPIVEYEDIRPYVERIQSGEKDVLWPGLPKYFAKTSGTTSGTKYIPVTRESMPYHVRSAVNAMLIYTNQSGNASFYDGNLMFMSGSPELSKENGILIGRLSGIVNHDVPGMFRKNQVPSWETNCIEDWETKVDAIVEETLQKDMRLISGIPPWVQMYFDKIIERTGKKVIEVFPNLSVITHGGVNFEPYKKNLLKALGTADIDFVETYPASEGFIAYQDVPDRIKTTSEEDGLLLLLNNGIFFEFIAVDDYLNGDMNRLSIGEVKKNVNYVLIINSNAGLWGYNIGDTVRFTSLEPYRVVVSGRLKQYMSAFGEHVIVEEVEDSISKAADEFGAEIIEFHVAPQVNPEEGELPYHEWFIEFAKEPENMEGFIGSLDQHLQNRNTYYFDLIQGNVLQRLKLRSLEKYTFIEYMKSLGKLGGQNKVPRLANDRKIADVLSEKVKQD